MDQYGKWGWCTSRAAGGGTKGPSSPVSCQWLLEKWLPSTQRHPPQAWPSGQLLFVLTACPHSVCDIHKGKKRSLTGHFQGYFLWMDNIKAGSQTGKPLTDSLLSEIRNVWIPNLNPSKYFQEPVQALCNGLNTEIIPRAQSTCSRWGGRNSKAEQISASNSNMNCNLFNWFWQAKLGTGDTKERGHGPKDARYWLWPFTEEHLCCVTSCLCS